MGSAASDAAFLVCVILGIIFIIVGFVLIYGSGLEHVWTGIVLVFLGVFLFAGPFAIDAAMHGGKTGTSPHDKRRGRRWKGGGY